MMISKQSPGVSPPEGVDAVADARKPIGTAARGLLLGTLFAVLVLWLFIWLADEVMESATQKWDAGIVDSLLQHSSPAIHAFMAAVTWLASGMSQAVFIGLVALYFLWKHRFWPDGAAMLVAGFGGMLLDEGLKRLFHRHRPEPIFYHLGYSFPSGHAFSAVVVYGLIAYWLSRKADMKRRILIWTAAVILMAIVGVSRVYLGQHYPTDVIGGYFAGSCWLWGCTTWLTMLHRSHTSVDQPIGFTNE